MTQEILSIFFELLEDHRRYLLRRISPASNLDIHSIISPFNAVVRDAIALCLGVFPPSADKAFDTIDGIFRISDALAFGELTDELFATFGKSNDTRSGTTALRIGNDDRDAAF